MCKAVILLIKAIGPALTKEFLFAVVTIWALLWEYFVHICMLKRMMKCKCFVFPFSSRGQSCPQKENQELYEASEKSSAR